MMYRLQQLLTLAREYAFITGCLIVILVAGNISVYFNLQNAELERVQARLRNEGNVVNRTISAGPVLASDAQLVESALKEIDSNLVTEDNLAENLGYFYIFEDQTQTRISDMRQNPANDAPPDGKYRTVPVSLSVKGSYNQVFDFLHKVETGSRLIKISSFTMHRTQPTGDAVTLAMELNMLANP